MKTKLFGLSVEEINTMIQPLGLASYRARQIAEWVYQKGVQSFTEMTTLSKADRDMLSQHFSLETISPKTARQSKDKKTTKYLLELADGNTVETVLMRQPYGNSVCVSSQIGCAMGCSFCASTLHGFTRNLSVGEILAQVFFCRNAVTAELQTINNIVIMGMGEPLANYDNVLKFIRLCHEPYSLNLGYRNITLSTAGLIPQIIALSEEHLPITLSISLHASNDCIRSCIMPVNDRYPIKELLAAGDIYAHKTGRRVTYEYTLISGMNDKVEHAEELAKLLTGRLANVNLIPVNSVEERGARRPPEKQISLFLKTLATRHINATIRREMGADIDAACGQLRNKSLPNTTTYVKIMPDLD